MKFSIYLFLAIGISINVNGQNSDTDWYRLNGNNPQLHTGDINDSVLTNGRVGIGTSNSAAGNGRIDAPLHVVSDQLTFDFNYQTSTANASSRFGIGSILDSPTMVVVSSEASEAPAPTITEFRTARRAQADAAIKIRGSRDKSTTSDISQIVFSNYDFDITSEYNIGRIAAGIMNGSESSSYLTFQTNNGTSLERRMFLDSQGNLGIGSQTAFSASLSPTRKLDVDGNGRFRSLPTDFFF